MNQGAAPRTPLAVTATATYRVDPTTNQDRAAVLRDPAGDVFGVVVCDGVGSWPDSGPVAEAAVSGAVTRAAQQSPESNDTVNELFRGAYAAVDQTAPELHGATTMLVAFASQHWVHFAHLGNGALIEAARVRGTGTSPSIWWVNHLIPHIDFQDGQEVLSEFLARDRPGRAPTHAITTRRPTVPTVYLAVTDGILSRENNPMGRVEDGSCWERMPTPAVETIAAIRRIYELLDSAPPEDELSGSVQRILQESLDDLAIRKELDDDATIGCLIA